MSLLSQALPLGYLPSPHSAFQGHAAHITRWPVMLRPKGSTGTCIPVGITAFLHAAFTAHRAGVPTRRRCVVLRRWVARATSCRHGTLSAPQSADRSARRGRAAPASCGAASSVVLPRWARQRGAPCLTHPPPRGHSGTPQDVARGDHLCMQGQEPPHTPPLGSAAHPRRVR